MAEVVLGFVVSCPLSSPKSTRTLVSLHHTPEETWRTVFYSVVRAGHAVCGPDARFQRDSHPGHELIFCLRGHGRLAVGGTEHLVPPGSVAWVNCHHPHAYWPDPADPWEHLWLRFEGPQVDAAWRLLQEGGGPLVSGLEIQSVRRSFAELFRLLDRRPPDLAPRVHGEVARLLSLLFAARLRTGTPAPTPELPPGLRRAVQRMRLYHHLPLRIRELARIAGMSESHFIRSFRRHLGTSPIDWLRRERYQQARRRLSETDDSMKQVARQCGWGDQFQFSKDFRRLAGVTPTEFRRQSRTA
jgi:AraC-like DNA-binding protein